MSEQLLSTIPIDSFIGRLIDRQSDDILQKIRKEMKDAKPVVILSEDALAEKLGITRQTVAKLRKRNKIPYFEIGGAYRYDLYKVLEALEKNKQG